MSYKFHEDTECAHKTCLMMKQCHESLFLPFLFKVNTSGSYLDLQLKCKAYIPLRRKILASGVGVGQLPRRQTFALGIPTCWYLLALPPMPIPDANPKICVTPDANPRRQSVALGLLALGLALGMYISCCLCQFHLRRAPNANSFFGEIWA